MRVSVNAKNLQDSDIDLIMAESLKLSGLQAQKIGNFYTLKKMNDPTIVQYYRPKFRSVEYLTDLLKQAYPSEKFGFQQSTDLKTESKNTEGSNQYASHTNDVLIYRTSPVNFEAISNFITMVDTENVTLQVVGGSYEYTDNEQKSSALNAFGELIKSHLGFDLGINVSGSGSIFKLQSHNINAILKIVDTDSRFKSISKPSLLISSGENAVFNAGSDVPILGGTSTQNGTVTQNVQYRSSGTLLNVKPTALLDVINVEIKQEFSSFIQNRTSNIETPILNKRLIDTKLAVKDGDFIVLAGLSESSNSESKDSLFNFTLSKSKDKKRSETLLLLQITKQNQDSVVINTPDDPKI